jgi:CheY-like chemotaxis protein
MSERMSDSVPGGAGPQRGGSGLSPVRILLVEDQEVNRALVGAILSRANEPVLAGAELIEADTLATARRVLAERSIASLDVVLLDVQLPDGSGLDLLPELVGPGRPRVVALTGGVLAHQRDAALNAGCDAFLDKPFRPNALVEVLVSSVGGRL